MNKNKILTLTENFALADSITNNTFTQVDNQILAGKKIIAGFREGLPSFSPLTFAATEKDSRSSKEGQNIKTRKVRGNFFALRNFLVKLSEKYLFQLEFFNEKHFADKVFDDANYFAVLYFQSFYPPENTRNSLHIHWENFRFDDWVRNKMNYCYVNAVNVGNEFESVIFEASEILRFKNALKNFKDKNFTLVFIPDKPESPVSAHSAITAATLMHMNINICLPENFPLDFEALSNAEVTAAKNKKTFTVNFSLDDEILKNSDLIVYASWAQLGKHYNQQVQENLLAEQKINFNLAKLPPDKLILPALSYPFIKSNEYEYIEKAFISVLSLLV